MFDVAIRKRSTRSQMADPNASAAIVDDDRAIVAALSCPSLWTFFPRENGPRWPPPLPVTGAPQRRPLELK